MDNIEESLDDKFERYHHIKRIADKILESRDEAIEYRSASGVERRWREDARAFDGIDGNDTRIGVVDAAIGEFVPKQMDTKPQSRVVVNIIRSKCETAESEFCEILLPVDDKNWGLKPTPIPEASQSDMPAGILGLQQQVQPGMPQPAEQPAQPSPEEDLKKRVSAMEAEIDDQLTESEFNGECRKVVRQSIKLGTGILKGPNIVKSIKKTWNELKDNQGESVHVLKVIEESKPASKMVDVWNAYPSPHWDGTPGKMSCMWEKENINPRELRALIGVDGYDSNQIRSILEEEPMRKVVELDKNGRQRLYNSSLKRGAPYEKWEYHGDCDKQLLELMGCECPADSGKTLSVCALFVNDRPIKIHLNTLDTGDIIYDFFQWVEVDDSPWGIGEPRKMLWQYKVINAAWRMMMNNSGDSAGAQIVMNEDVEPEDDNWDFRGRKFWIYTGDGRVQDAFGLFQINNNQTEYQRIIELALKFTDLETGTPMMAQGEKYAAPETFRGMEMLLQNSKGPKRRKVKQWDDRITRPHLKRYYDWNMQYNKKNEIKGDMQVDARGTSVLLVKDQNVQQLMQLLQLRNDPEVNIQTDWAKVIQQLFQASHLDVMKSDSEIEQARVQAQQNPPIDPALQIAQLKSQGELEKTKLVQDSDMIELDKKAEAMKAEFALKLHMQELEQEHQQRMKQMELEIKMMELSQAQQISLESIKAALSSDVMKLNVQKELSAMNHIAKQTSMPETEPAGKAAPGHAYEQ
jgi:hypothetical protein